MEKAIFSYVYKKLYRKSLFIIFLFLLAAPSIHAGYGSSSLPPFLEEYYSLVYGKYNRQYPSFVDERPTLIRVNTTEQDPSVDLKERSGLSPDEDKISAELSLEGEIYLNLQYGGDFSLKEGVVTGAGSSGITSGLKYDLIERVLLVGQIGERLYVEFDYDSERSEEGILEETNTYSILYRGKDEEFLKEVSLGNKYLTIPGSRYIPIDEGNPDSFALRARAGWDMLSFEGLFRYEVATEGRKQFKGFRKNVDMKVLDVDYVQARFFFLPDKQIDESSLLLYKTSDVVADIIVDSKDFVLLSRGIDYDFDNTDGFIYLDEALELDEELIVYYEKGGDPVGSSTLGANAVIETDGTRVNFRSGDFTDFSNYFDGTSSYLYLKKIAFNSYWELRNAYYLEEIEGESIYSVDIELLFTLNSGINDNYSALLDDYEIDTSRGIILFNFNDGTDFYYRPFPGEDPYDPLLAPYASGDPKNPFDPDNLIYGGLNYPTSNQSINTIRLQYEYSAESFFLDFNLVPGSVRVTVNGNELSLAYYTVDHDFGIITFDEGVINPSSDIVITYRYNPFGEGDKSLFSALGVTYENDWLQARNLTAFSTGFLGREAPAIGEEQARVVKNSTELKMDFGAVEDQKGLSASIEGGFAFSITNKNAYGSAVVADMEREDYLYEIGLDDDEWILASESTLLPGLGVPVILGDRGDVLYKNYYKETVLSGDELQKLSWSIPQNNVFDYSEKAGPYNAADRPSGGNDSSLVIDYEFSSGSTDSFVSIVVPVIGQNVTDYERFNLILKGDAISVDGIRIYAEVLQTYNEDINNNNTLDGENSINDSGFQLTFLDGNPTTIGTDREGKSNGQIESEDINDNGIFDRILSENGVVVLGSGGNDYLIELSVGDDDWEYVSVDILDLINNNREVFQYVNAIRLTVKTVTTAALPSDVSGKIVINKVWFSGSSIINNSKDYINISEVSEYEDPDVRDDSFSDTYPGLYEELHGDSRYRDRNDLIEKVLKLSLINTLSAGVDASISRRFGTPADFTPYREFRMYLYRPSSVTIPANLDFTVAFLSSTQEKLEVTVPGTSIAAGWNKISIDLRSPYTVSVNDTDIGEMQKTGTLSILKRVSEIRFGLAVSAGSITPPFEIWLDEWFVTDSEGYFDKAFFTESTVSYTGAAVSFRDFSFVENPALSIGFERREGSFYEEFDYMSDKFFTGIESDLLRYVNATFFMSNEKITPLRNKEELPNDLDLDGSQESFSHRVELDVEKDYLPVLEHTYDRTVTKSKDIELTQDNYRYKMVDLYGESLGIGEQFAFPFGFSHSYWFNRNWSFEDTSIGEYPTFILSDQQTASLNQIHSIYFAYSWQVNTLSLNLSRDEVYTGSSVPNSEKWLPSYKQKLSTIFKSPGSSLEDAALSSKGDALALDLSIPLVNKVGFNFSLSSAYYESNWKSSDGTRDTVPQSSLFISVPFYFPGNEQIEILPQLEREIKGDYKSVDESIKEGELLYNTGKYLFMPPFYYINPFKGLGRIKDYDAVDEYKDSSNKFENTTNTLSTGYRIDTYLQYERWFIPSSFGFSIDGETKREGETYTQKRITGTWFDKYIYMTDHTDYYERSINVSFDYENERNFATKVLKNTFSISTGVNLLKEEWRGIKTGQSFTYTRERQKIGNKRLYLFPESPEREIAVSEKPYKDTIESEVSFEYLWEYDLDKKSIFSRLGPGNYPGGFIQNTEKILLENIYTFTDREKAESFSNIPFRITAEHNSSYRMTENVEFGMNLKTVVGIEEKIIPPSISGNVLPSMGLEIGIFARIIF